MKHVRAIVATVALTALVATAAQAQVRLDGKVIDAETRELLIGVNVIAVGTTLGATTGLDGQFSLESSRPVHALVFSYVGYQTRTIQLADEAGPLTVALESRLLDLQPVIVTASRTEEKRTAAPVAVAALSAADLAAMKPNRLADALSRMPGVHVTDLGNEQHTMSIRQPMSYKALYAYLEDGIPIRPTGIFNHNALIEINMAGMERIEVIRGPSSSLYGSNAVGGAVNFITPRPSAQPQGSLSLRTDNYGYRRADGAASSTFGRLGLWAGGYVARQRESWSEHSDFDKVSLTLRADYAFAPLTRLVTTFSTNHFDTDTNGNLDSLNFYRRGFTSLQTFTYRTVRASRLASRLEHVWDGRNSTDVTVYWRDNAVGQLPHYRIKSVGDDRSVAAGEVNEDSFWSLGLNVQHRTHFDWLGARLITGATLDRSPNAYLANFIDVARDPETGRYLSYTKRDSLLTDYAVKLVNAAAYAQFEVSPLPRLKLVSSLRYDRITYGFDNHLAPSAFSGAPDSNDRFGRISPRAGLTYDLGRGRGLYGNYSRGFLPPEISELYRGVKVPTLKPSTFDSYEVGGWAAFLDGKAYADVSLYRMDGVNEIVLIRLEDGSTENRNAGKTRHVGVEYALTYTPARAVALRLTGTAARHEFVRYEENGLSLDGNRMDAAPAWMSNAEAMYRPPFVPGLRLALGWEHVGSYYMDPQNTMRYDGYDLLNLRLGYEIRNVELWMNLENLTDELYANIASKSRFGQQYTPGAPRSLTFGVGYRFQ